MRLVETLMLLNLGMWAEWTTVTSLYLEVSLVVGMQELSLVTLRRQIAKDPECTGDVVVEKLLEEVPCSLLSQPTLLNVLDVGKRTGREILDKVSI